MVRIDLRTETVDGYVDVGGSPQDVKLSPDGRTFYVANRYVPSLRVQRRPADRRPPLAG